MPASAHSPTPPGLGQPISLSDHISSNIPLARIGRIGWDSDENELVAAANRILLLAKVNPDTYHSVSAITWSNGKGSSAQLCFVTQYDLQVAKQRITALKYTVDGQSERVWLDFAKTKAELRLGRVINRAAQYLQDVFTGKGHELNVDKRRREITVNNKRIAWVIKGELRLTISSNEMLTQEEQTILTDYANDAL